MFEPVLSGRFDTGSRALYAELYGEGPVTVIIEPGSTMPGTADPGWVPVRDALAGKLAVLLYDRANLGRSDLAPMPRTPDDFAADLRGLLSVMQVAPPYVLVGASLGGLLVAHYASRYPEGVAGVLLLDPPHPRIHAGTLALLPEPRPDEPPALAAFRQLAWMEHYSPQTSIDSEGYDYQAALRESETWGLGDIPTLVLTAGINEYEPGMPPEVIRAYEALWLELNKEYAALSTRGQQITVVDSDHIIHDRKPELIIQAIESLAG